MSEKSKGDTSSSTTSRIINNPLLSANITNLTFDDFQNKPVILPAAPPIIHTAIEDVSESLITTKRTVTVGKTPEIDADTLSEINLNPTDDEQLLLQQRQQQSNQFQQIDLNDNNAFPQIQHEPRLINNNQIADDSILSQAASSFSQLPSVASTVLSTFSKVINNYSPALASTTTTTTTTTTINREQSSGERDFNSNSGIYQQHQLQQQQQQQIEQTLVQTSGLEQFPGSGGFNNQYLYQSANSSSVTTPEPSKLNTPPPIGTDIILQKTPVLPPPLTAGGNTYRLSSKKKTYAKIPGLSVNQNTTATDNNNSQNQDINNLPPKSFTTTDLSNATTFQLSSQPPLNSFLNETNTSSSSPTLFGNNTPLDLYQQQTPSPAKSDKPSSSSSVVGLFSGVSGVIQNLSGFVKSTVSTDSNQSIDKTNTFDSYNQNKSEPQFIQSGFTAAPPPVAFSDTEVINSQVYNPTVTNQIGFEPIQSSIQFNLNQENIKPTAPPPPCKPPIAATGGSSFRLQKGTRLYKSPFEQNSIVSGANPPYPIQSSQQPPGIINLPSPTINFDQKTQGSPIIDNLPPIPAPESFQSYPSQNIPSSSQIFNLNQQTNFALNTISQQPQPQSSAQIPIFQHSPNPVQQLLNPQIETVNFVEQQIDPPVSNIQQNTQGNQYFKPTSTEPTTRPQSAQIENFERTSQVNLFNPQIGAHVPEQTFVINPTPEGFIPVELNKIPPSVNQEKTEFANQTLQKFSSETSSVRPPPQEKFNSDSIGYTPNIFNVFNPQTENSNLKQSHTPGQINFFDSVPQPVSVQPNQFENNLLGSSSVTSTSFTPSFIPSIENNNQNQFNRVPVEANRLDQNTIVHKIAELELQEKESTSSVVPPPANLPPPTASGIPLSGTANPFRRDSTKSHHTSAINFFVPKSTTPQQENTSVQQPINQHLTSSDGVSLKSITPHTSIINTIPVNTIPEAATTVDYFNPITSDEWAQQLIKETNPNITKTSVLNSVQLQSEPTLDSAEPFPERFDFSTLLSTENSNFKYLPPSIKPKPRTDSVNSLENNCPPPIEFRPPAPLPIVNGQPQIGPEASIAEFYNPTPSHEWAQQVIDAANQGLTEIPQQENTDNSRILQGTIEAEEEFPDQFDFSSVLEKANQAFKYLPPPIDNKVNEINTGETSEDPVVSGNIKILKIAKETLPEGAPSSVGEFLTEISQQSQSSNIIRKEFEEKDKENNHLQKQTTNLFNYFGIQEEPKELQSKNNQQQINITANPVEPNFFQNPAPTSTSKPQLNNFFNSNLNNPISDQTFLPIQKQNPAFEQKSVGENQKEQSISKTTSVDKNLNYNVSEKNTPEKLQQQNLFTNFFQPGQQQPQQNDQQQILTNNLLINQSELLLNNQQQIQSQYLIQQQQQQQQQQPQQQQPNSGVSFFDQFSNRNLNNNNNNNPTVQQQTPATGQLNDEDQRIQNFFNNPPPQNLNNNSVNELNFKNLYGCGGIKTKQFSNTDVNLTPGKNSDNRSATPASNIVEPPSSACSEFSSDFINNNSTQNLNTSSNTIGFDYYLNQIPDELIAEYNKMANANTTNAVQSSVPCNVVYTPAKKHWFYKKNELNKQIWTPFTHKDSDALEESFMKKDRNIVPVEGGRHDVNINDRTKTPIYWKGEPTEIRRCSWFYKSFDSKYVPYEEETAEFLESEYREASNSGDWRKKITLANGESVMFYAPTVLVHFLQAQSSDAWGGSTQSTIKPRVVKRDLDDFTIEVGETDKVDHLLFMVHGIGSACDLKFRGVEEVVEEFRSIAYQLVQAHYKNSVDNGDVGRVEVLPVSWHHELHSAECGIDEQLKAITLESIPKLRNFANDTVVDALFYTSPVFCQYIINTVANCMNRVFLKFCQRNTNFSGQVSLAGHSLGSLILFDLLCNQKPIEDNETNSETLDQYLEPLKVPNSVHSQQVSYTFGTIGAGQPTIEYPQLLFAPKKFFALGSPIGLFVTVRGIGKLGLDFKFPTCSGFYNIFHPYDPIAYRIEALINPEFSSVRPVLIPHHKGRKRMHLELKETMTRVGSEVKQRIAEIFKGTMETVFFLSSKNKTEDQQQMEKEVDKVLDIQLKMDQPIRTASSSCSDLQSVEDLNELNVTIGKLNDSKRVDYVLQEAPLEFFNEYLFALTSHVCYWDSEDTILFLVKEIYSSVGISTDATIPQQNMTIERPSSRNTPTSSPTSPQKLLK